MTAARNRIPLEAHAPLPAQPDAAIDVAAADHAGDCPWTHRGASAAAERLQSGIRIEDILADVANRR